LRFEGDTIKECICAQSGLTFNLFFRFLETKPIGVKWKGTDNILMIGDDFQMRSWASSREKWVLWGKSKQQPKDSINIEQPNHDKVLMILENNTVAEFSFQTQRVCTKIDLSAYPWDLSAPCKGVIQISEEYCAFIAGKQLVLCKSRQTFYTVQLRGRY